MKARFIEKYYMLGHPVLVYEYRGYKYDVTDYGWNGGEPLSWQHANEKARIDRQIEITEKEKTRTRDTKPVYEVLDEIFEMLEADQ